MHVNSGRFVYGTLALGALLAAESARQETYAKTIAAVAVTLVLYWLAGAYSEFAAERLGPPSRPASWSPRPATGSCSV